MATAILVKRWASPKAAQAYAQRTIASVSAQAKKAASPFPSAAIEVSTLPKSLDTCPGSALKAVNDFPSVPLQEFNEAQMRSSATWLEKQLEIFPREAPVEEALTAPASWYTDSAFFTLERHAVFQHPWLHIGHSSELPEPGTFLTRSIMGNPVVVVRDDDGKLRAFHNVCSHHAMPVAEGSGKTPRGKDGRAQFTCPYHGWTYLTDGRLRIATQIKGLRNFKNKDYGLKALRVAERSGLVFMSLSPASDDESTNESIDKYVNSMFDLLGSGGGSLDDLIFVRRRHYDLDCNWKVFCDNYLDGGYHVPYAHGALAAGIDMSSYSNKIYDTFSMQTVVGGENKDDRVGGGAAYAFVYPNLMLNRYGPWLDTNTVYPLGPNRCRIVFDYFLEKDVAEREDAADFVQTSLESSNVVQDEDELLCNGVQAGLVSQGYNQGRYNPVFEGPMHHFHNMLYDDYSRGLADLKAAGSY